MLKVSGSPSPSYDQASLDLDKQVYVAILKLLPYPKVMSLIETHNFAAPFTSSIFSVLDKFVLDNEDPSLEFIDTDLEGLRVKLIDDVSDFANYLATHTWRLGEAMQSVPSEWEDSQPDRHVKVVNHLNVLSSNVANDYRSLVREARRRLGVHTEANAD